MTWTSAYEKNMARWTEIMGKRLAGEKLYEERDKLMLEENWGLCLSFVDHSFPTGYTCSNSPAVRKATLADAKSSFEDTD